jgi:hypothetical protein
MACSNAKVYEQIKSGALQAKNLDGKTVVTTESIIERHRQARPWLPDHSRINPAKRARLAQSKQG